jgi:hypothetical protein
MIRKISMMIPNPAINKSLFSNSNFPKAKGWKKRINRKIEMAIPR